MSNLKETKRQLFEDMYYMMLECVKTTPKEEMASAVLKIFRQAQSKLANLLYQEQK